MADGELLACDWGTTHVRAWVLDHAGKAITRKQFPLGVSRLAKGEAAIKFRSEIRNAMGADRLPAILCGMIGSTLGWTVVPYRDCPADLGSIAQGVVQVEQHPPAWIVPGLKGTGIGSAPDVMRGEETQILGWLASDPVRALGRFTVCHPGTHAKWAEITDGRIVRFITAMTGELFDLLRHHSILRADGVADDELSFDEGLAVAGDGSALAARLFTARARAAIGQAPRSPASYLSGLLIGAEIASLPSLLDIGRDEPIALLGDPELCRWYARGMTHAGLRFNVWDGEGAVLAGLMALYNRLVRA